MRIATLVVPALAAVTLVLSPSGAVAQARPVAPTGTAFEVTPYAGYLFSGDLVSGPLGSAIGAAPAPLVGTQVGMRIAPNLTVIGNLATGSSDVKAGIPILGGVSVATSRVVLYDAGLQLDLPMATAGGTAFSPFVQGGVGGMRYELSESFATATSQTLTGNLGVGADISVGSGVGLRLMAKDYIGKLDFQTPTSLDVSTDAMNNYALSLGVRFSF